MNGGKLDKVIAKQVLHAYASAKDHHTARSAAQGLISQLRLVICSKKRCDRLRNDGQVRRLCKPGVVLLIDDELVDDDMAPEHGALDAFVELPAAVYAKWSCYENNRRRLAFTRNNTSAQEEYKKLLERWNASNIRCRCLVKKPCETRHIDSSAVPSKCVPFGTPT